MVKDATGGINIGKDGIKFVEADGITASANTPSLSKTGIDAGNQQISNVKSGGTTATNAANIGDVNTAITGLTNKGLIFGANDGADYTAVLGSKVTVKGATANTDFSKFDGGANLMTQVDATGNIVVGLKKDVAVDSITAGESKLDSTGLTVGTTGDQTVISKDGITTAV